MCINGYKLVTTAKESELERCRKDRRDCTKQCTVNYLQKVNICIIYYIFKVCVCYFLSNVYVSTNDICSKTIKNVFYFIKEALFVLKIFKFLYFHLPLFFSLSAFASQVDPRKTLKFMMSSIA